MPPKKAQRKGKARGRPKKPADQSIQLVAKEAGVSVATVSKVFLDKKVRADKRAHVLLAARRLDFTPRFASPTIVLAVGRTNPTTHAGYTTVLMQCVLQELARTAFPITIVPEADENAERLADTLSHPSVRCVIAIVFTNTLKNVRDALKYAPPVVTLNRPIDGCVNIWTDHHRHAVLATEYLLEREHRCIAFLAHDKRTWGAAERLAGYRETLRSRGIEPKSELEIFTHESSPKSVYDRIDTAKATALLSFAEDLALPLASHYGQKIPKALSVIGLDDLPIWQTYNPPFTVINQGLDRMASRAVEEARILAAGARGDAVKRAQDITLPAALIPGKSVADLRKG